MNLQCPACQKLLTVPEQYAGQLMKCPLCSAQFTVPALPPGGMPEPAFGAPSPPPASEPSYTLKDDPSPMPAFMGPPASPPEPPPMPAFPTAPPSAPGTPPAPQTTASQAPPAPAPAPTPSAPATPGGYTGGFRIVFDPAVLQYVPAAALVLIFVLQFFPWVGVFPGGVPAATQGAWGAATGSVAEEKDLGDIFRIINLAKAKEINDKLPEKSKFKEIPNEPGFSPLLFFYLIPFFFLALIASVAVVILPHLNLKLPPAAEQLLPWKWAIVAGLNAVLLLFLLLQMLLGFSLESNYTAWVDNKPGVQITGDEKTPEKLQKQAARGEMLSHLQRTYVLRLVFILHVLAAVSAGLVYWSEKRGPSAPKPVLELKW